MCSSAFKGMDPIGSDPNLQAPISTDLVRPTPSGRKKVPTRVWLERWCSTKTHDLRKKEAARSLEHLDSMLEGSMEMFVGLGCHVCKTCHDFINSLRIHEHQSNQNCSWTNDGAFHHSPNEQLPRASYL